MSAGAPKRGIAALRAEAAAFRTPWGGVVNAYNRVARRFAFAPGRGKAVSVRLRGLRSPARVRLGTTDLFVVKEIFGEGEYDDALSLVTGEPRLIVDLGANIGLSVRLWRERFPSARVIGVEPDEGNLRVCRENAEIAGLNPQDMVHAFVGGTARRASTGKAAGDEWAIRLDDTRTDEASIEVLTLPQLLEQRGASGSIDILKCDIEGSERELFEHCAEWIGRVRLLIIELHAPYLTADLMSALERAGSPLQVVRTVRRDPAFEVVALRAD